MSQPGVVAVAQLNPTVGDLAGNVDRMLEVAEEASSRGAELVVFPELTIPGYPPQDLVFREDFIQACDQQLQRFCRETPVDSLVGTLQSTPESKLNNTYNSVAYIKKNKLNSWYQKQLLPTYDVFDEARYFQPGAPRESLEDPGVVTVCEDIWNDPVSREIMPGTPNYPINPVRDLMELEGASSQVLYNLSASPYETGKPEKRINMVRSLAREYEVPVVLSNMVGGNDSLIFDGHSVVVGADGEILKLAEGFEEDLLIHDFSDPAETISPTVPDPAENVYRALKLGLEDYFDKCGFTRAVVGVSGGIDSAVTAVLAADALGPENVLGVMMPSLISSRESVRDGRKVINNLEISSRKVPIHSMYDEFMNGLREDLQGTPWDETEENIQARIRGDVLMAYSNKQDRLLLSTGNKAELAVGYCTLYGDMNGGLAVLSDVPKTMVYELARYRNRTGEEVIPEEILDKPPSAELAPDQKDQDTLPPYEVLDEIIERYVEQRQSIGEMVEAGLEEPVVRRVVEQVDHNEYKRQQAPPGLKVTSKSFGVGRVMPIAQGYQPG